MAVSLSERTQKIVRATFVAGFVATWLVVAVWEHGPRAFWTGFLPLVPIGIVLIGFHMWRTVCPLAAFSRLGQRIPRSKQRRVGAFLEKYSYLVALGTLTFSLTVRLLFTNGDGVALGVFLASISLAAFVSGAVFTGKTWCNFFCPVGIVEKIYTEPANLYAHGNSQCPKCTACKKHCPDIDEENHYWKEIESPARRIAYLAFPGLVWGFYTAFALPNGTLQDYFSGAWTNVPRQYALVTAPGLFFATAVPRFVVMPVYLLATMALSFGAFSLIERVLAKRTEPQRARHLTLTLAAFAAFTSFYLFAGQPTLRRITGVPAFAAIATVLVGTLFLVRRWNRREDDYVQERSVKKILAKWPYDEPPPKDPREVFAFVKSKEREGNKLISVYADAVREVLADGVVEQSEHRLLERLRAEFGISKADHDKVLARLSAEDRALFDPANATSIEQRLQEAGYRLALQNLLLSRPREQELEQLRISYGVDASLHARLLAELRSTDSPLRKRAIEQLDLIDELRVTLADAAGLMLVRAFQLVYLVLLRRQTAAVARTIEFVGVVHGDPSKLHTIGARLFADSHDARREGLRSLAQIDPEVARRIEPAVLTRKPPANSSIDPTQFQAALQKMIHGQDPILAAAALVAIGVSSPKSLEGKLTPFAQHAHPLVREASAIAAAMVEPWNTAVLDALVADPDPHVRATATGVRDENRERNSPMGLAAAVTTRAAAEMLGSTSTRGSLRADMGAFAALPTPERMLLLAAIPLFADLEPEHLYDIAVLANERTVTEGEALCREGEPGDEVFVLIAGIGEVFTGEGELRNVIGQVKAGDCVGELAVLDQAPRAATVGAAATLRVLVIQGAPFRDLMSRQPDLANTVISMITRRLRSTLAKLPAGSGTARASMPERAPASSGG